MAVDMSVLRPSWFAYRQGVAEEVNPQLYKLTGPNLREMYIGIEREANGCWDAFVRAAPDGANLAATGPKHPNERDAWHAAFEIYRNVEII